MKYAKGFYQQAHELTNQKNHIGAIERYTKVSKFYEAIDNRAFCFMDLGNGMRLLKDLNNQFK
ncbi:MAG: hypothetical protein IPP49_15755 [Saprospiraceae bacterium]|nr:hypothetical protein [Saprospiraceae bacterium]